MEIGSEISRGDNAIVYNCRYGDINAACKIGKISKNEVDMIREAGDIAPKIYNISKKDGYVIVMEKLNTTLYESIRNGQLDLNRLIELGKRTISKGIFTDLHQQNIMDYKIIDFGGSYYTDDKEKLLDQWSFFISMCTVKEFEPEIDENIIYRLLQL